MLYKWGDCWAFNHWETYKHDEALLGGSEKCLDQHYFNLTKEQPSWDSEMYCTLSTDLATFGAFKPTTKLTYLKPWEKEPTASWYADEALGEGFMWWLCPFWADLFPNHEPPKTCYALFTPSN